MPSVTVSRPGTPTSAAPRAPFASPPRFVGLVTALAAGVVAAGMASMGVGSVGISPAEVLAVVRGHVLGAAPAPTAEPTDLIVWTVRLPRTVLGILVGAALAISGAVIQAVVRNPLGDPYLIGIVPGAGLGAVLVIVLGSGAVGGLSLATAAFAGAMLAFAATFALGRQQGRWPPVRLVLAGVAIGYLFSAFTYFLQTLATPTQLQRVRTGRWAACPAPPGTTYRCCSWSWSWAPPGWPRTVAA